MKKTSILILSIMVSLCSSSMAFAIDFKAKGEWVMRFDYGSGSQGASATKDGGNIYGYGNNNSSTYGPDSFDANHRIRLQFDAIASESLSGTVYFEVADAEWGNTATGAALGADARTLQLKQAYIDWVVPSTQIKLRMGIQGIALPSYTTIGSMVLNNDAAGIVASNKFSDNISLSLFWVRLYNDNYINEEINTGDSSNYLDNVDMFGLSLPLSFDGFKIIPWATYMAVGNNFNQGALDMGNSIGTVRYGLTPEDFIGRHALSSSHTSNYDDLYPYANVWHAGITGELTMTDPIRIAFDFNYGHADFGTIKDDFYGTYNVKRHGFYGSLLFEYKMNWGTPGIYGWYSSGDDDDPNNGSERMPTISNINAHPDFSHYAGSGAISGREGVLGRTLIGTWGLGVRIQDLSFIENLKHTPRINFFNGTNSTAMAKHVMINDIQADGSIQNSSIGYYRGPGNGFYLTTADYAIELGLTTEYQIYENLELCIEMGYINLYLNQGNDVWGDNFTATDAWNINASITYSF